MRRPLFSRLVLASALPVALFLTPLTAAEKAPSGPPPAAKAESGPTRHPLKGVVVDVVPDRGSLLVKHEEVPGIMRAMTMLFKVTEADLKSVQKDQAITGLMVRKPDGWWLEAVKPAAP